MKEIQSDNMFTISLEDYCIMAKHGAYDFEHLEDQPFIVTIRVTIAKGRVNDDLDKTVNYADLQATIDDILLDTEPIRLMETMAEKMIDKLKSNALIEKIIIRIEKPEAPLPHKGGLAVVEAEWSK
ncbi:MAG: dihydroneopterin aldolase [Candidatus Poseidoniaceae archaeon]|jgi:dihydroneopterin aldolase|nr:dihydroneopterin aldolase [Candidatus Poseidoniaceae archaeon]